MRITLGIALLLLGACAVTRPALQADGPPLTPPPVALNKIPEARPRAEPLSRYGNPVSYEALGKHYKVLTSAQGFTQRGLASWYGRKFAGQRTSSGEPYNPYKFTAAHKTLPIPTFVRVTDLHNGREIIVRVNDRGPFHSNRIIDLSYAAAKRLHMVGHGTVPVKIQAITFNEATPDPTANTTKQAVAKHALFLQTGAFAQVSNAHNLLVRLKKIGLTQVFVSPTTQGDALLYRVRLGPFADNSALAQQARKRLAAHGISALTRHD